MSVSTPTDTCSPLISVENLHDVLTDPDMKVFDVRGRWSSPPQSLREDYLAGHVPGAVYLDWTRDYLDQGPRPGLASVSSAEDAGQTFKSLGINEDDRVVIYDDYHHMFAGRIWWAMRYWGFRNVRVLDGGWQRWVNAGLPDSSDSVVPAQGNYNVRLKEELRIGLDDFIDQRASSLVIDARGAVGYAGKPDDKLSGHIPGAINVPYTELLNADSGTFKHPDELRAILDAHVPGWTESRIIASCGSGYSATVLMLAMMELGFDVPLFDDSFAGWKEDASRPIERGSAH